MQKFLSGFLEVTTFQCRPVLSFVSVNEISQNAADEFWENYNRSLPWYME